LKPNPYQEKRRERKSNMRIPGFTAEASLYKTSEHYRLAGAGAPRMRVLPQQILAERIPPGFDWSVTYLDPVRELELLGGLQLLPLEPFVPFAS
jgi:hypothetical protein